MKFREFLTLNEDAYNNFGEHVLDKQNAIIHDLYHYLNIISNNTERKDMPIKEMLTIISQQDSDKIQALNSQLQFYIQNKDYENAINYLKTFFDNINEDTIDANSTYIIGENENKIKHN